MAPISINGSGTVTGVSVGGLPDGTITGAELNGAQTGTAPIYGCRAWVNFDGSGSTGTNMTIRGSGNVSSVYKNGTGDYTITFTTAMPDANYSFTCSSTNGAGGGSIPSSFSLATILTTSFRMIDARPAGAIDRDTFTANFFR
jgi:hypothetical protein